MRLVACPSCHTQYDVSEVDEKRFACRCGVELENRALRGVDATTLRCGSCGALTTEQAENCGYCGSTIVRDAADLSLICPECYGRNAENSRFCTACGVAFDPQPIGEVNRELSCPRCEAALVAQRVGDVAVHECSGCRGLWAPEDRFERLVARAAEARKTADSERLAQLAHPRVKGANPAAHGVRYLRCPDCQAFMRRRNFRKTSGVILDTCRDHGTWLDSDELEQIAGFILSGGRPGASELMRRLEEGAERDYQAARVSNRNIERVRTHAAAPVTRTLLGFLSDLLT